MVFTKTEYLQRLKLVKQGLERAEIEVLIVVDPANMNYLSGYDGWSFYQHQALIIFIDQEEPICVVRGLDRNGARQTCFLKNENIKLCLLGMNFESEKKILKKYNSFKKNGCKFASIYPSSKYAINI